MKVYFLNDTYSIIQYTVQSAGKEPDERGILVPKMDFGHLHHGDAKTFEFEVPQDGNEYMPFIKLWSNHNLFVSYTRVKE